MSSIQPLVSPQAPLEQEQHVYTDRDIATEAEDKFIRYPFAMQLAKMIRNRRSADSLVVGLYGEWGAGKTSILNFIVKELSAAEVLIVRFNPWRFVGEDQLLMGFFAELNSALGAELKEQSAAIKMKLDRYSKIILARQAALGDQETAEMGRFKDSAALESLKHDIDDLLASLSKRVLVIIDDIDRLNKEEIESILRLVKLTGDFSHTTYLLALDEKMVAKAIGEKYVGHGKKAGMRFLEKIIQVPIRLPMIQSEAMERYFHERIQEVLRLTETHITSSEQQRFNGAVHKGIIPQLSTPRQVSRYCNTLLVALPMLQGEANNVDLMLIEGLKAFHPTWYNRVSQSFYQFTGVLEHSQREQAKLRLDPLFGEHGEKLGAAGALIFALFPAIKMLYDNSLDFSPSKTRTEDDLYNAQSIASTYYFKRYFSYAVQVGEIPDNSFTALQAALTQRDLPASCIMAEKMVQRAGDGEFIRRLELTVGEVTPETAESYYQLLFYLSTRLTSDVVSDRAMRVISRTNGLILSYLKLLPDEQVVSYSEKMVSECPSLNMAFSFFYDLSSILEWSDKKDLGKITDVFSDNQYRELSKVFIDRLLIEAKDTPWYIFYPYNLEFIIRTWSKAGGLLNSANESLAEILHNKPEELMRFLHALSPSTQVGGTIFRGSLRHGDYDFIRHFFDVSYLRDIALKLVDNKKLMPYKNDMLYEPTDHERLHQFLHLYNKQLEESKREEEEPDYE